MAAGTKEDGQKTGVLLMVEKKNTCSLIAFVHCMCPFNKSPSKAIRRMEELEMRETRMKEREHLILTNEHKLMEATRTLDREVRVCPLVFWFH